MNCVPRSPVLAHWAFLSRRWLANPGYEMNLLVLTNIPNPYNRFLYDELRQRGVELSVVFRCVPSDAGRPWSIELSDGEVIAGTTIQELRAVDLMKKADAIILTGSIIGHFELLRRLLVARVKTPVVVWGERFKPHRFLGLYRRWFLSPAHAILAVGNWAQPSYRRYVRADTPIHVLPYTTSVEPVARRPAEQPTVGFVGSLIHRKGLDILLRAVALTPVAVRPQVEIMGSGPDQLSLEQLALDLKVSAQWMGESDQATIASRRSRWWAQVVPSRYDGWGVVVSEALAQGVPVIASTGTGAALDLVRTGVTGTLVEREEDWPDAVSSYSCLDRSREEGKVGRVLGQEIGPSRAADLLLDVIASPSCDQRNLITEAWERVTATQS